MNSLKVRGFNLKSLSQFNTLKTVLKTAEGNFEIF